MMVRKYDPLTRKWGYDAPENRIKLSFTISAVNEEKLYALSQFVPQHRNKSAVIDQALELYFRQEQVKSELDGAYDVWNRAWAKQQRRAK